DRTTTRRDRCNSVQRLHLRMIGIVAAVFGFDHAGGALECAPGIALPAPVAGRTREILRIGSEGVMAFVAVEAPGHASPRPGDRADQRLPRGKRRPRRLRDHTYAVRQPDDGGDTGDRL